MIGSSKVQPLKLCACRTCGAHRHSPCGRAEARQANRALRHDARRELRAGGELVPVTRSLGRF